ncbi:MAG: acyl-CoA dehydratase activase-related protein [Dialister sp.]
MILAGRPYHTDPAVHHGIPDLINQLGMAVLSEDGIAMISKKKTLPSVC